VINSFQNKIVTIQHANQSIIILTQCVLHQLVHTLTGCNFMYLKIFLCIICQCSNAEPVICMRDVGKDSFVRSMEIRRDEVYSRTIITGSALEHWHIMHCSQFNVSFLLFGLEGEGFKGLPNDAIIRNMNVSVRLNSVSDSINIVRLIFESLNSTLSSLNEMA
jgi:hypothetical protein